jgi:hypothetical protein
MQWVKARSYPNEAEATLAVTALESADVPAQLHSSVPVIGWPDFQVMVPSDHLESARALLGTQKVLHPSLLDSQTPQPEPETRADTRRRLGNWRVLQALAGLLLLASVFGATLLHIPLIARVVLAAFAVVLGLVGTAGLNHVRCPYCGDYMVSPLSRWDSLFSLSCARCGFSVRK